MLRSLVLSISFALKVMLIGPAVAQQPRIAPEKSIEQESPSPFSKLLRVEPGDDEVRTLRKACLKDAIEESRQLSGRLGSIPGEDFLSQLSESIAVMKRATDTALELVDKPEDKLYYLTLHVDLAKKLEDTIRTRVEAGTGVPLMLNRARYNRLDAEIRFLQFKKNLVASDCATAPQTTNPPQVLERIAVPNRESNRGPTGRFLHRIDR